jgi:hypothetical protein
MTENVNPWYNTFHQYINCGISLFKENIGLRAITSRRTDRQSGDFMLLTKPGAAWSILQQIYHFCPPMTSLRFGSFLMNSLKCWHLPYSSGNGRYFCQFTISLSAFISWLYLSCIVSCFLHRLLIGGTAIGSRLSKLKIDFPTFFFLKPLALSEWQWRLCIGDTNIFMYISLF